MKNNTESALTTVSTLPVSTAECERGFSFMNLILTEQNERLLTEQPAVHPSKWTGLPLWKRGETTDDASTGKKKRQKSVIKADRSLSQKNRQSIFMFKACCAMQWILLYFIKKKKKRLCAWMQGRVIWGMQNIEMMALRGWFYFNRLIPVGTDWC